MSTPSPEFGPGGQVILSEPPSPVGSADEPDDLPGPVERALREDLSAIQATSRLSGTLIASALALAHAMDRASADKIASIGKEFREHLKRIEELSGDDDDSVQHRADLSTPV